MDVIDDKIPAQLSLMEYGVLERVEAFSEKPRIRTYMIEQVTALLTASSIAISVVY